MGDSKQISVVVKKATVEEILAASMVSSKYWVKFQLFQLSVPLRLAGLHLDAASRAALPEAERFDLEQQQVFRDVQLAIGNGNVFTEHVNFVYNFDNDSTLICLPSVAVTTEPTDVMDFLYPTGFDTYLIASRVILAGTNVQGDEWNKVVQDLNPKAAFTLNSADVFNGCDDPNDHLKSMISTELLNRFDQSGVPAHVLVLKVNDICIVLRNLSKRHGLANNVRLSLCNRNVTVVVFLLNSY